MLLRARPLLACGLSLALVACTRPPPAPEPVRAVRTLTVVLDSAGGSHEYAAEVRARTESRLGFRVGGKMISRGADVGQRVQAGQVLARLDAADLKLGQDAAQAAARAAQTSVELAAAEVSRYRELRAQGFISGLELERRESTLRTQQAGLEQVRAQVGVQANQAGYAALVAPAAGVVTAVEAEPGAVLAAGTPVLRLAHDGPRDAVFAVPEDGVDAMRELIDRPGVLRVRPWAVTDALPATVREVAAAADPVTRTFQVKADIGRTRLQLGQTLTVQVDLPRLDGVAKLPLAAVTHLQGGTAVWLLDRTTMTVRVQPVVVGGAEGNAVVVASGLTPGQTVVTAGVHALTPGQKVKLFEPAGPDAASAPSAGADRR